MTDLTNAIAELRRVTPATEPWEPGDFGRGYAPMDDSICVILNAVLSGALIPATERDAAVAAALERAAGLQQQINEATDPDFIWGAMDNVNDMDADIDEFAKAASRAIRAALYHIKRGKTNG